MGGTELSAPGSHEPANMPGRQAECWVCGIWTTPAGVTR